MGETERSEQTALPLPGLEIPDAIQRVGALAAAVRRSIAALAAQDLIAERDAARLALALEMADIIEIKKRSGRMSTVGNDAKVLVDLLDKLLPQHIEVDVELRQTIDAWSAAIAEQERKEAAASSP